MVARCLLAKRSCPGCQWGLVRRWQHGLKVERRWSPRKMMSTGQGRRALALALACEALVLGGGSFSSPTWGHFGGNRVAIGGEADETDQPAGHMSVSIFLVWTDPYHGRHHAKAE